MKRKVLVEVGHLYGYLLVLEETGQKDKYNNYLYKCRCINCNKEKLIRASHLLSKNSRSCGCLMRVRKYPKGDDGV